ncbi:MAG: asparagine synthase (glutamine-hydrolyzing) [Pseudomonadota bacterium]|nr:asparagine synthase (glutamine-hydrolyzing) [Pseudomonadota bacterium]
MCGIAGYIGRMPPGAEARRRTLATMARRGPDDSGQCEVSVGPWRCVLLHTRLAIIDPDPRSAQPFEIDGRVLIYNGEIYNYLELREMLIGLGHVFRTDSDTEVLLRAYLEWGEDALDRLEGMWAFAIADPETGSVLLSRDRFGEKPLLTHRTDHGLYFASEVKQLVALTGHDFPVRTAAIGDFLAHGYRRIFSSPETYFEGVVRFPSGHAARMTGDGLSQPAPYWRPRFAPVDMTAEEAAEGAMAEIDRAIRIRLRADVPIAISLSGGIDSNVLAGIAVHRHGQPLHTFSMLEQDSDYDESAAIRLAQRALGVPAHETRVSHEGFLDRLAVMSRAYDGPVPSLGMYLDGFLSEAVADEGYKVLINGNGADEIFAGYYDHYLFWLAGRAGEAGADFDALVAEWRDSFGRHVRNPLLQNPRAFLDAPNERGHLQLNAPDVGDYLIGHPVAPHFAETAYCGDLLRMRMLNELMSESVPVLTWAHDSHYMHHSIENRAAYLDRGLVDFMATVPSRHLIQGGFSKALLRRAGEGVVPPEILHKTQKLGFNAPIASLLDRGDDALRERLLVDSPFWDLVDRDKVRQLLDPETESRGRDNFLFCLVSARLFYEEFVD